MPSDGDSSRRRRSDLHPASGASPSPPEGSRRSSSVHIIEAPSSPQTESPRANSAVLELEQQFHSLRRRYGLKSEAAIRRLDSETAHEAAAAMYRMIDASLRTAAAGSARQLRSGSLGGDPMVSSSSSNPLAAPLSSSTGNLHVHRRPSGALQSPPRRSRSAASGMPAPTDGGDDARGLEGSFVDALTVVSAVDSPTTSPLLGADRTDSVNDLTEGASVSGHGGGNSTARTAQHQHTRPALTRSMIAELERQAGSSAAAQQSPSVSSGDASNTSAADTKFSSRASSNDGDGIFEGVNDYLLMEQIGAGQTGRVVKAVHADTGTVFAVKIIPRSLVVDSRVDATSKSAADRERQFRREIAIMKSLKHKNIARLHEVIDDPEEGSVYMVLPLLPGGPLLTFNSRRECEVIDGDRSIKLLKHVVAGLQYLKRHRIVHRDLKPDNILLSESDTAVLVDFGQSEWGQREGNVDAEFGDAGGGGSRDEDDEVECLSDADRGSSRGSGAGDWRGHQHRTLGSPAFMAPEVVTGQPPSYASDVWSLGVIAYAMRYGRLPFLGRPGGVGENDLYGKILDSEPEYDDLAVDLSWNDLLRQMLMKDPDERIGLSDIKRHPALALGSFATSSVSSLASEFNTTGATMYLTPLDRDLDAALAPRFLGSGGGGVHGNASDTARSRGRATTTGGGGGAAGLGPCGGSTASNSLQGSPQAAGRPAPPSAGLHDGPVSPTYATSSTGSQSLQNNPHQLGRPSGGLVLDVAPPQGLQHRPLLNDSVDSIAADGGGNGGGEDASLLTHEESGAVAPSQYMTSPIFRGTSAGASSQRYRLGTSSQRASATTYRLFPNSLGAPAGDGGSGSPR